MRLALPGAAASAALPAAGAGASTVLAAALARFLDCPSFASGRPEDVIRLAIAGHAIALQ